MVAIRGAMKWAGAALSVPALALAPSLASTIKPARMRPYAAISLSAPGSIGSFTPAAADPRRAASLARAGLSGTSFNSGTFRFTPSAAPGSRRAVTVAVRARATSKAAAERAAIGQNASIAPSAYNLGVSVGWKQFALSGDVAKVEGGLLPTDTESADIGVSYSGKSWSTRLQLGADRATGSRPHLMGPDQSYSVDLGGSYSLTRNLEVTGGVRYKLQRDRLEPLNDERRDSQAVYIGTAFRF
jgi:hypothetical protein